MPSRSSSNIRRTMPIYQINLWVCEVCGLSVETHEKVMPHDDPVVCLPDENWEYITIEGKELLACPKCQKLACPKCQKKVQSDASSNEDHPTTDEDDIVEVGSLSPKYGGSTECGRKGINHRINRHTKRCLNPGCDAWF